MENLIEAEFTLFDEIDNPTYYKGVYDPSVEWNGWACPYFDEETAKKILTDLKYIWALNNNMFEFTHPDFEGDDDCDRADNDLYPLGDYAWTWSVKPLN